MQKAGLVFVAVLALHGLTTEANEPNQVHVKGWAKHCDAACQSSLTGYTKDGEELPHPVDLSKTEIVGLKEINDYEMVNVSKEIWVENDAVNIDYCDKKAVTVTKTTTRRGTNSAMGSGTGCEQ